MMRRIAGFKYAVLGLLGFALVGVACSDEGDAISDGGAGDAGKSSSDAGSAGKAPTAGSSSSGAAAGGTNGGTSAGSGTAGNTSGTGAGGSAAGSAGTDALGGAGGVPDAPIGGAMSGGAGGAADEGGGAGGGGGQSGAPFVADVLDNPGFEVGTAHTVPTGWTNEGTDGAAYVEYANARSGFGKLSHYKDYVAGTTYTARTYQTVAPIANGTYSFSIWVDRGYFPNQHLFARGFNAADPTQELTQSTDDADAPAGYVKITLSGIPVTSGTCTVGVDSSVETGTYANFDDAEFTLE